jgi:hypothetical protein
MASWSEFAVAAPQLAVAIQSLVHQYGPGLGYLATVRADGGPRVHPVSPVVTADGLFCFVLDSPKRHDLERDGRYALHSFPAEVTDDEAYLSGRAQRVADPDRVRLLARELRAEPRLDWRLYEFTVDVAMVVRHEAAPTGNGDPGQAVRRVWRDPASRRRRRGAAG